MHGKVIEFPPERAGKARRRLLRLVLAPSPTACEGVSSGSGPAGTVARRGREGLENVVALRPARSPGPKP